LIFDTQTAPSFPPNITYNPVTGGTTMLGNFVVQILLHINFVRLLPSSQQFFRVLVTKNGVDIPMAAFSQPTSRIIGTQHVITGIFLDVCNNGDEYQFKIDYAGGGNISFRGQPGSPDAQSHMQMIYREVS
jgi:hypothetical protein